MRRSDHLERLPRTCDILVVGGGATGLGVAVDSASRGYSTVLLEARDFAQGTSSTSTNLIHGGVRYLQQGNIGLVRSALRERGVLARNAPHLVGELRLLLPAYAWWEKPFYGAGLKLYDTIAGPHRFAPSRVLNAEAARGLVPGVRPDRFLGGVVFSDGQFNDTRLAMCLARTSNDLGATLVNHAPVVELVKEEEKVAGAIFIDLESGELHTVRARAVINATGVMVDALRRMDERDAGDLVVASQGTHLVLPPHFLGGSTGILVPRTKDGRLCFVFPWQGRTLLGTTDVPVSSVKVEPVASEEEIDFLLESAGEYLSRRPTRADVLSVFSGLRPLVKGSTGKTSALSRDHTLEVSSAGMVTVAGGKWTTYRHMAESAVDKAAEIAALPARPCTTQHLALAGSEAANGRWAQFGVDDATAAEYERRFPGGLHPALPYTMGMVGYVIEEEMPVTIDDVLSRRLRALRLDAGATLEAAPVVAEMMAGIQKRDRAWIVEQLARFTMVAQRATIADLEPAGLGQVSDGETGLHSARSERFAHSST